MAVAECVHDVAGRARVADARQRLGQYDQRTDTGPRGSARYPGTFFQTPGSAGGITECVDNQPEFP